MIYAGLLDLILLVTLMEAVHSLRLIVYEVANQTPMYSLLNLLWLFLLWLSAVKI